MSESKTYADCLSFIKIFIHDRIGYIIPLKDIEETINNMYNPAKLTPEMLEWLISIDFDNIDKYYENFSNKNFNSICSVVIEFICNIFKDIRKGEVEIILDKYVNSDIAELEKVLVASAAIYQGQIQVTGSDTFADTHSFIDICLYYYSDIIDILIKLNSLKFESTTAVCRDLVELVMNKIREETEE